LSFPFRTDIHVMILVTFHDARDMDTCFLCLRVIYCTVRLLVTHCLAQLID
jgi:hypothetical protein